MLGYRARHRGYDCDFVPFHREKSYSEVSRQNRGIRSSVPRPRSRVSDTGFGSLQDIKATRMNSKNMQYFPFISSLL